MTTENLSTLKIHSLTQEQYERELAAGRIDETAIYLTPYSGNGNDGSINSDEFLKKTGDIMTGPLSLTQNVGYGNTLPASGTAGQLFFLTSDDLDDGPSLPIGGTAGQILVKNSSTDGDASWQNGNYLPLTGGTITGGLILNSQNYVDSFG